MGDQHSDNSDQARQAGRPRLWVAVGPDVAAGYERNALGEYPLLGLVVYGPSTTKLRGLKLRDLATYRTAGNMYGLVISHEDHPPSPEAVREAWGQLTAADLALARNAGRGFNTDELLAAEAELDAEGRRDGEDPEAFYARIARAHQALDELSDKPTAKLAKLAGVPVGTAASWVSRAREKGLYGPGAEGDKQ